MLPQRVMRWYFSGWMVSMLMFTRFSPASARGRASSLSRMALVVMARSWMPGTWAMRRTSSTTPGRMVGSPPVRRILFTPRLAPTWTRKTISSSLRSSRRGRKVISSGMQ